MAIVDVGSKTITLKIVYYGCALGGKTTNLITLHRLTDPNNRHGLVSIATKDDRTLFFDLLPMELGQVGGLGVKVKIYTVPGQVHYELTRRQVLSGADGVVMVVDSADDKNQENNWAMENLRYNLKANSLSPDATPIVVQWNKRDLENARPVSELEAELNRRQLPSEEAVATTGIGVVETFSRILKVAIVDTYRKTGRTSDSTESIEQTVDAALIHAKKAKPAAESRQTDWDLDHRFDMEAYRDQQAEQGRDKRIVDEASLLSEAVNTNMVLAEKLDEYKDAQILADRRHDMFRSLGGIAPMLADPVGEPIPDGMLEQLLTGCGRRRGSILLFRPDAKEMEERQVVPEGRDPLNEISAESLGSTAYTLCRANHKLRVIEDLEAEVFFGAAPPQAEGLGSVLAVPVHCDGLTFGGILIYERTGEAGFDLAEHEYWSAAATFIGLSLHWRALRKKLLDAQPKD